MFMYVCSIPSGNVPSPLTSWNSSLLVELHSCVDDNDVNIAEELCKKTSPCAGMYIHVYI